MLQKETLKSLRANLKAIFALKVTRSTFREMQNAVLSSQDGNQELATTAFDGILSGTIKKDAVTEDGKKTLQAIIDEFTIPARLAKEVSERGEFISIISSDALNQKDQFYFLNRLRRIDGEEFQFLTDLPSMLHLLRHISDRINELKQSSGGDKAIGENADQLKDIAKSITALTA